MKRNKVALVLLTVFTALFMTSCEKIVEWSRRSSSYVDRYIEVDDVRVISAGEYPGIIVMGFSGTALEREEHDALNLRYMDTYYNKYIPKGYGPGAHTTVADEFTNIHISSNTDFNSCKPGSSLNGVVRFAALSPKEFIRSGYKSSYDWENNTPEDFMYGNKSIIDDHRVLLEGLHPVCGNVTDLTPEDLLLLSYAPLIIRFTEEPLLKEHLMRVAFQKADGSWVSAKFNMKF